MVADLLEGRSLSDNSIVFLALRRLHLPAVGGGENKDHNGSGGGGGGGGGGEIEVRLRAKRETIEL